MGSNKKEPENRPRERIEKLISTPGKAKEHRLYDRLKVEPGTDVVFSIVCKGEILDFSEEGFSVRFTPSDSPSLQEESSMSMALEMENHNFKVPAKIKRVESRFGVIVMGVQFEGEDIEIFESDDDS